MATHEPGQPAAMAGQQPLDSLLQASTPTAVREARAAAAGSPAGRGNSTISLDEVQGRLLVVEARERALRQQEAVATQRQRQQAQEHEQAQQRMSALGAALEAERAATQEKQAALSQQEADCAQRTEAAERGRARTTVFQRAVTRLLLGRCA